MATARPDKGDAKGTAGSTDFTFTKEREREDQRKIAAGEEPGPGYFEPVYVDSSRVAAIRYVPYDPNDAESGVGTVFVRFHKYDDPWAYYDVPFNIYNEFVTASSVGRYINAQMNNYHYNRASDQEVSDYFAGM